MTLWPEDDSLIDTAKEFLSSDDKFRSKVYFHFMTCKSCRDKIEELKQHAWENTRDLKQI